MRYSAPAMISGMWAGQLLNVHGHGAGPFVFGFLILLLGYQFIECGVRDAIKRNKK